MQSALLKKITAMTSELRPAVEVWRQAHQALYWLPKGTVGEQGAAAVIEAYGDEREAKGREEQAAARAEVVGEIVAWLRDSDEAFALTDIEIADAIEAKFGVRPALPEEYEGQL